MSVRLAACRIAGAALTGVLATAPVAWAATAPAAPPSRATAPRAITYVGDRDFPPYEYLDRQGRPQGFNVDLVRALGRELRVPVALDLVAWKDVVSRLDAGEADLVSLAYSDRRASRYSLLWQTWTLHQSLVFRPGRASYPSGLSGLAREVVAVEERSLMAELLKALPEHERPAMVGVPSQIEAVTRLGRGGVTAAAGNDLTLRHAAAALDLGNLVVVPVKSVSYHLATRPGSDADSAAVTAALQRLAETGEIDRLVELHLSHPVPGVSWRDQAVPLGAAAAIMLVIVGAFFLYNRQLRTQVANRTEELERSLLEVRRSGRARERALEALQGSESRYRSLIQNMLGGLLVINDKGRIVLANPSADRMFGYEPGELVGESLAILLPPRDEAEAEAFVRGMAGQALGRITEWEGRRKNGSAFPFELSMFEFESPGGRLFAGHLVDISERREVARMKDEFVAVVSHELRTPLTSMRASMQLLVADGDHMEPTETHDLLAVALNSTERLVRIVNDMLDVAKIEAGRFELRKRSCSPMELVEQAVLTVQPLARNASVEVSIAVAPALARVQADPDRLVQALVNLLSNALKFAPPDSVVTVGAEPSPLRGTIRFWVHDTGRGIAQDQLPKLFQKFQQLEGQGPARVPGTGLGLAITKALVEQHDGRVGVTSSPGEGTTFFFTLPLDAPAAHAAPAAAAVAVDDAA
jgi:PAS domain S-box-containing protein